MTPAEYEAYYATHPDRDPWWGKLFNAVVGTISFLATGKRG